MKVRERVVLFVGGPWDGKIEHMEAPPILIVPIVDGVAEPAAWPPAIPESSVITQHVYRRQLVRTSPVSEEIHYLYDGVET